MFISSLAPNVTSGLTPAISIYRLSDNSVASSGTMSEVNSGIYKYEFQAESGYDYVYKIDFGSTFSSPARYQSGSASSAGSDVWGYNLSGTLPEGSAGKKLLGCGPSVGVVTPGALSAREYYGEHKKLMEAISELSEKVGNIKFEKGEADTMIIDSSSESEELEESLEEVKEGLARLSSIPDSVVSSISGIVEGIRKKDIEEEFKSVLSIAERDAEIDSLKAKIAQLEESRNMVEKELIDVKEKVKEKDEKIKKLKSVLS